MKITVKYPKWHEKWDTAKEVSFEMKEVSPVAESNLERLFAGFGNHPDEEVLMPEWRQGKMRSMSVGDFVSLDGKWYQCAGCGWIKVTEARVKEVMAMPQYDTWTDLALR